MWCPEGYVTLEEIISQLMWDIDLLPFAQGKPLDFQSGDVTIEDLEPNGHEMDAFIKWSCAALFRLFGDDFRICTSSGTLVRVNPNILLTVRSGWLGTLPIITEFPTEYDNRLKIAKWEIPCIDLNWGTVQAAPDYGPLNLLAGAPICISEANLGVALQKLAEWLLAEAPKLGNPFNFAEVPWSSNEVVDQIVRAFSSGLLRTKGEAKNMFAKGLPVSSWNAVWEQVCKINPKLSRPGPRSR